jgi:hypothetical protein
MGRSCLNGGTGGIGVVGGSVGGGTIFTASSDPGSTDPNLLSRFDDFGYDNSGTEGATLLTLAITLGRFSVGRSDGESRGGAEADRAVDVIASLAGVLDGVLGVWFMEPTLLLELQAVNVGKLGRRSLLWLIVGRVLDAPLSAKLLDGDQAPAREGS